MTHLLPIIPSLHISPLYFVALILLGVLVGYASGLFGAGGSFIITPLLIALFGMKEPYAIGASVTQLIAVGIVATKRHAAAGYVDFKLGFAMAPSMVIGATAGSWLLEIIHNFGSLILFNRTVSLLSLVVNLSFVIMLTWIAGYLWNAKDDETGEKVGGPLCWANGPLPIVLPASGIARCSLLSLIASGILIGFLAGLLGIGGGVLLVPLLLLGYGLPLRIAIGTGPLLILFSAFFSTINHAYAGNVDVRVVLALLAGSVTGVQVGVWHSHRICLNHLRRSFSLLVLSVVIIVVIKLVSLF